MRITTQEAHTFHITTFTVDPDDTPDTINSAIAAALTTDGQDTAGITVRPPYWRDVRTAEAANPIASITTDRTEHPVHPGDQITVNTADNTITVTPAAHTPADGSAVPTVPADGSDPR
jgi:hypothetical protein